MADEHTHPRLIRISGVVILIMVVVGMIWLVVLHKADRWPSKRQSDPPTFRQSTLNYQPRHPLIDTSGYPLVISKIERWPKTASLESVATSFEGVSHELIEIIDGRLEDSQLSSKNRVIASLFRTALLNYNGHPQQAYQALEELRTYVETEQNLALEWLHSIIYFQGVTALRVGENDNCIMCKAESSCILPIVASAIHTFPKGSRLAIDRFTEYLRSFPDDLEVKWLLNIAHMTLGEHPQLIDPKHLLKPDRYLNSEFDIGRFRDIGQLVGVNRLNFQGGGIMDDFDNDGLLDIVTTSNDLAVSMALYCNKGDGTFAERTKEAGLQNQLGGLFCVQADYDNDGYMDVFVPRGAWFPSPVTPSLLRNNGNGTFTDVTKLAGLDDPMNSLSACWADFDNDGFSDLFVPGNQGQTWLYRNNGNGSFENVTVQASLNSLGGGWRSAVWIDYDNDRFPDLFVNRMAGTAGLYRNNGDGTFSDVTTSMGIDGPRIGFSCFSWDFDNDGWSDIFATSYEYPLDGIVLGLLGKPHTYLTSKLYRNLAGQGFEDVTKESGLDMVFGTMGSNFGDFDNDGYLDIYLATGGPDLATLVPNRMFKNIAGKRFAEITASSGTGNLQKGHSVACGDWNRNGTLDIFVQMGGVTYGDEYYNILLQNPGQGNNWVNLKLVGKQSNTAAIGARIKVVTAGTSPLTVFRCVSSGSSFGANALEQMIGLGKANTIAKLEIFWPTSGTTQTFRDLQANQAIEITEFAGAFGNRAYQPISLPTGLIP